MRRGLVIGAVALVAGAAAGWGSASWWLGDRSRISGDRVGGWVTNRNTGAASADPYTRALVARYGLLALAPQETVYFTRATDDAGEPLRESCDYELAGQDLPTRWWAITLYAHDDFLAQNTDQAHSIDATRVRRNADGRYVARIAAARGEAANWISSKAAGRFNMSIRLYNPAPSIIQDRSAAPLPTVRRLGCREGQS